MKRIYLDDEFRKFWDKIESKENFALMRSGDGEYAIMTGRRVKAREGWESPLGTISKLGYDLYESHQLLDSQVFYGISCPDCDREAYYWYSSNIPSRNRTFANLWVNSNYIEFKQRFANLQRDAVLIANYRAQGHALGRLSLVQSYFISDDCFSFWENDALLMLEQIKRDVGSRNNLLYVISAGPMSGPIIAELYKHNPHNCYIDFGSSIDSFYREKVTRPYMDINNKYAQRNCWMDSPQDTSFDVSVIMNVYKHPASLESQLIAIENQTLKAKEILLYQDGTGDTITIPQHLRSRFNVIEIGDINKGVWERFYFAERKAQSTYVCVLDDDTIPGRRWLENCHASMLQQEGLYGTIGVLLKEPRKYPYKAGEYWKRIGWANPNIYTVEVDFVGHAWFFKREWLQYLIEAPQEIQYKVAGEDMGFSFQLQKHGISTFVPPHPDGELDFFGSNPVTAATLGTQEGKVYSQKDSKRLFNKVVNILMDKGWNTLQSRSKYLFTLNWNVEKEGYNHTIYLLFYIPLISYVFTKKRKFSFLTIYRRARKTVYSLFGILPVLRVLSRKRKQYVYLFGIILLFTIEREPICIEI